MALTKEKKQAILNQLKQELQGNKVIFFVNFQGIKTKELFALRKSLKKNSAKLEVVKKTLLKLSFKDVGVNFDKSQFEGEVAVAFGPEEIKLAKLLYEFAKKYENLKILGGYLKNGVYEFIAPKEIVELAKLPSREELLAKLVWTIANPISRFINLGSANIKGLVLVLSAIKQ